MKKLFLFVLMAVIAILPNSCSKDEPAPIIITDIELSDDELSNVESDIQKVTDKFVSDIDKILDEKTKEIMTV